MIWVPHEVLMDVQALRKQVEQEVEAKYKQRIDLLNRSIDVLERENVRLNRAVVDIKRTKKAQERPKHATHSSQLKATSEPSVPTVQTSVHLDDLIARKELEFQQLGMFA